MFRMKQSCLTKVSSQQDRDARYKMSYLIHQRRICLFKVVTCRTVQRLPRAAFGCSYILISCYYNIPKQTIILIYSFLFTNHLSHLSHLIVDGPHPSYPRDILKIKEGIFSFPLFSNT